jgi:hypothetical protein
MTDMQIVTEHQATLITSAIQVLDEFTKETRKKTWDSSRLTINNVDACNLGTVAERAQISSESLFQVLNCAAAYFNCPNAKAALDERHKHETT